MRPLVFRWREPPSSPPEHGAALFPIDRGLISPGGSRWTNRSRRWLGKSRCGEWSRNAGGPQALGDLRRRNGASSSVLKPDLLEKLKARLLNPPPDGGLWTSPKVAAWMAGELGLAEVLPQRGWEALKAIGWSVQKPRPRHPASATPEEREVFKKTRSAKLTGTLAVPRRPG